MDIKEILRLYDKHGEYGFADILDMLKNNGYWPRIYILSFDEAGKQVPNFSTMVTFLGKGDIMTGFFYFNRPTENTPYTGKLKSHETMVLEINGMYGIGLDFQDCIDTLLRFS